jgi:hypothetical protein
MPDNAPPAVNFNWAFDPVPDQDWRVAIRQLEELQVMKAAKKPTPEKKSTEPMFSCSRCLEIFPLTARVWKSQTDPALGDETKNPPLYSLCSPCLKMYITCSNCKSQVAVEKFDIRVPAAKVCDDCGTGGKQPLSIKQMPRWTPKSNIIKVRRDKVWKDSFSEQTRNLYFG